MKYVLLILTGIMLFAGCGDSLEAINRNPNNPEQVDPAYLLNTSVFNAMNLFGGKMRREVFSHYSHYVSVGGGQFQRYSNFPSSNNEYWQTAYVACLQPVQQIIRNHSDDPVYANRVAIARIFQSYLYSNIVTLWGSVPKAQALTGEPFIGYDQESEIYNQLLVDLKQAESAIDPAGDRYAPSADAIYAGDLVKWQKFARSLRLRLAVRIANADAQRAQTEIADILQDEAGLISSLSETAKASWGSNSDTWSYLYQYNVIEGAANAANLNVICESLIQHMLPYGDPRLPIYAKPAESGPHQGEYYGEPKASQLPEGVSMPDNPHANLGKSDYSKIGDYFVKPTEEFVFLSYEEVAFLQAEIALNGWGGSKPAEQFYSDGITASMNKYDIDQSSIDQYLQTPGIKFGTVVDTTGRSGEFEDFIGITSSAITHVDPFRQIVMQSWLAGFYQAMDAWTLIRRTQVLEFPPHFNPDGGEGGSVGYAYIPQRIVYPDLEYQVNRNELNQALSWLDGPDSFKTKLWFAWPTKTNDFLPE